MALVLTGFFSQLQAVKLTRSVLFCRMLEFVLTHKTTITNVYNAPKHAIVYCIDFLVLNIPYFQTTL